MGSRRSEYVFVSVPQVAVKYSLKMSRAHFGKGTFVMCTLPCGKRQNHENTCFNNMHSCSIHWVFFFFCSYFQDSMFVDPGMAVQTMKKGSIWERIFRSRPQKFSKGPFQSQKWEPEGPIPSFGGSEEDQSLPATLYVQINV